MQSLIKVTKAQHGQWHSGDHVLHQEACNIIPSALKYFFKFLFRLSYLLNYVDILN